MISRPSEGQDNGKLTRLNLLEWIWFRWVRPVCNNHSLPRPDSLAVERLCQSLINSLLGLAESPCLVETLPELCPLMDVSKWT